MSARYCSILCCSLGALALNGCGGADANFFAPPGHGGAGSAGTLAASGGNSLTAGGAIGGTSASGATGAQSGSDATGGNPGVAGSSNGVVAGSGGNGGSGGQAAGGAPGSVGAAGAAGAPTPAGSSEPLVNGIQWADTSGKPIQAHGGGMIKVADYYYWFGENRNANGSFYAVSVYRSRDLRNWEFRNHVLRSSSHAELEPANIE